jgi:hypothetical protein
LWLASFEHLAVPADLSGSAGFNIATSLAFIRAEHDLAAVHAYLRRYRDRRTTLHAHTRELFTSIEVGTHAPKGLLWGMSSAVTNDINPFGSGDSLWFIHDPRTPLD